MLLSALPTAPKPSFNVKGISIFLRLLKKQVLTSLILVKQVLVPRVQVNL
jgi:hypothetical protein